MQHVEDLRVYKTKTALINSLTNLLKKKKFEDISVQEICDSALIRRATFYTHFADKFDLFSYTTRYQFSTFPSYIKLKEKGYSKDIYKELAADAINFLNENQSMLTRLISSDSIPIIINTISQVISEDLTKLMLENNNLLDDDIIYSQLTSRFYINGILSAYIWWIKEKPPISKGDFIEYINKFIII